MIDPKMMDEHLKKDRYQRREAIEPTGELQFNMEFPDDGGEGPDSPNNHEPREYNNPIHHEDEELAPGLFQSDIDSWKKQYGEIWLATVKGEPFVYRALERYEYKEIISVPNADPLMREEMICEYCVLYPQGYTFAAMANKKAGIPALLSEAIMENSVLRVILK